MAYNINITNGQGSEKILNGQYSVTSTVNGYNNTSIDPSTLTVVEGTNEYAFSIEATGTLTLHVSDNGTTTGNPIVGATFIRTDINGNEYGTAITSDAQGNAVFNNVPFASDGAPLIYFKQTASDGAHEYSSSVQNTSMNEETKTIEITNAEATQRTISLNDKNYNLPLDGTISLN